MKRVKVFKIIKRTLSVLFGLTIAAILFIFNESKDQINAYPSNIEDKLASFYNPETMGGFAVSLFNSEQVLFQKSLGFSDLKNQIPYNLNTKQRIASISKITIGVALLKAHELGLLDINDPINKYLPFKVENPRYPKSQITLKQLATHSSSLDYNEAVVESLYLHDSIKAPSIKKTIEDYFQKGLYGEVSYLDSKPGETWSYSNLASGLAAYIIEVQSKTTFDTFTQNHIFNPLGLRDTEWSQAVQTAPDYANYYEWQEGKLSKAQSKGVSLYPCRDLITNIKDLTKFTQAIMNHDPKLLNQSSYQILLNSQLDDSISNLEIDGQGLFWIIDRNQYGIMYQLTGHAGGDNCINTMLFFDPYTDLGYIFLGNTGYHQKNRSSHISIFRSLVSLGNNIQLEDPKNKGFKQLNLLWHDYSNRLKALFA